MSNPSASAGQNGSFGSGRFISRSQRPRGQQDNWRTESRKNKDEEKSSTSSFFSGFSRNPSHYQDRFSDNTRNYRRAQHHESGDRRAVIRQMGFKYLQDLLRNEDLEQVIFSLNNDKRGFKELLESREISNDMIVMLVKLQCRICDCSFPELKLALFELALRTSFMDNIVKFVSTVALQSDHEKNHNALFWNGIDEFWKDLLKISVNYHDMIPTTSCEAILKLLKAAKLSIPVIVNDHKDVHISDEVKVEVDEMYKLVESTYVEIEKKLERERVRRENGEQEPPNDFRDISIYPSPMEVTIPDAPFLRPNVTKGPYQSVNHYLDVQFRLLREDFVAPLRKGICKYKENPNEKLENLKIYNPIKFLEQETVTEQNCFRIQFDFSKTKRTYVYENSRRFMFGALLCFTHDNFKTLLFGKVVKRDVKDCLENGQLIVGFNADVALPPNLFQLNYLMLESTVFFEPYYQVLNVLRKIRPEAFPMERYIIRVETQTDPPDYLLKVIPPMYTIESETFSPLDWGERRFYGLNDTQSEAFQAALTKEFAIIQGPPGTGKTFLGLRIAHTLLNNKSAWYTRTPILVICYTNHALDQFLEGLLPVTEEVVRVGGQSKNERLNSFNIRNQRRRYLNNAVYQRRDEVRDFLQKISTINSYLNMIALNNSVIKFSAFAEVVPDFEDTWFGLANSDQIYMWLFGGFDVRRSRQRDRNNVGNQSNEYAAFNNEEQKEEEPKMEEPIEGEPKQEEPIVGEVDVDNDVIVDDIFDDIVVQEFNELVSVKSLQIKLNNLYRILAELNQRQISTDWENWLKMQEEDRLNFEIHRTENELQYLKWRLNERRINTNGFQPKFADLVNPHRMTPNDRWQLYYHWLSLYVESLKVKKEETTRLFRRVFAVYSEMMSMEDAQVMKESLVVGMTTTGAARLQSSLQALRSPIVIVEEAAEVLEAHIISALTAHCKHLILIGDHQQLKPSAADFKIETKYRLGISLFERMVINDIQCHTLDVQHRMRPEISSLIRPAIYPVLKDHESTMDRPRIAGLDKCLYFIDHQEQEQLCKDNSKKNIHEAQFLIQLARHLVLNGYKPQNITILAAYLGQMFEMQREKLKFKMQLQDVRISVLDNYQGEESDIILLSLVRNNQENKIGFLKTENRVCVALSRARNGFYMMGNMTMLCNNSEIWPKIKETLMSQDAIGTHLALRCQVHTDKVTMVKTAEDFSKLPEGGCDQMCDAKMLHYCGHRCKRLCHVEDRDHRRFKCNEICERILCEDTEHKCKKRCSELCGPCNYPVERTLDCGHTVFIHCYIDPAVYKCPVLVEAKLPCDHVTQKRCHEDADTAPCPHPCDTRVEPCGHACMRACHIRNDPDHLKYECRKPCERPMKGCTMTEVEGHLCRKFCFEECSSCEITILKERTKCSHAFHVPCHVNVDDIPCEKPCQRELPCGHKCKRKCDEPCESCMKKVSKEVPDCKHIVRIACFQEPDRKFCDKKCPRLLSCGHPCRNTCKEVCTEDCDVTVDCSIPSPCGHTIKRIVCYRKDTANPAELLKMCSEKCSFQLDCGHQCGGSCGECAQGRAHRRCREKCGVPLVCGHDCPIPCREACKPCLRNCLYRCSHSVCKKKCGEPCTRCKEQCNRRCNHQQCRMKCWDYCDVDPCSKPCPKRLKCGHLCVGFCGDPCPVLCRICDREELTQIFLGNEDEEDAVYVMLVDCKHVFEAGDMQRWLDMDKDQIKPKVCPKCKTIIMKTDRYSEYIKESIADMMNVKMKYYGSPREIRDTRNRLQNVVNTLYIEFLSSHRTSSSLRLTLVRQVLRLGVENGFDHILHEVDDRNLRVDRSELAIFIDNLRKRLQSVTEQKLHRKTPRLQIDFRRQDINKTDLHAIDSKIKLINVVVGVINKKDLLTTTFPMSINQLNFILKLLSRDQNSITKQEVDDITLEIDRFVRFMQFEEIMSTGKSVFSPPKLEDNEMAMSIKKLLEKPARYDKQQDDVLKSELEKLKKMVASAIQITDAERVMIVGAVGLSKGHWFKCRNGHPYAIGECGGANQVSQCYECKAPIGGHNHRLLPGQQVATEMDGARHGAWSEAMNMENFRL